MNREKRIVVQMEGGLGKQVALTSLLPYFNERYEEVIVLSSYPAVFMNNPNVYRVLAYNTPYAYEEYFKNADAIVYPCGYRDSDFRKRRIHLLQAACNSINIEYDPAAKPSLHITATEEAAVKDVTKKIGDFIIIQSHGGRSPGVQAGPNIMAKDYNVEKMAEVVRLIHSEHPDLSIVNFALPGEVEIAGAIKMEFAWPVWFGLVRECKSFIAIDSSLQHMSAAYDKKGIVLWGATNPSCFGWPHNINITGNCPYNDLHCSRPYFVPSVDLKVDGSSWECPSKKCMEFEPADIVKELFDMKLKFNQKPTMDLSPFISGQTILN